MKKCRICGLPETYTGISFDDSGKCNYCSFFEEHKEFITNYDSLEKIFVKKVESAKEKAKITNSKYDCLVGFSGGKDSTYIIYQLIHKYNMRVLAMTFDNGFGTDYGRNNIENALKKLDVDHITVRMNDEKLRKSYRLCVNMMHNFCSVCFHYMHYYSYMYAMQNNIPVIVNGRTIGQILQTALTTELMEPFETAHNLLDYEHQMFLGLERRNARIGKLDYLSEANVEAVSYFAYHKVSEEETMRFLEEKIGWERPSHGIPHADCWAHSMAENMSICKRGFPIRMGELAVLVRMGDMTLEEKERILLEDMELYGEISIDKQERFYERINDAGTKQSEG